MSVDTIPAALQYKSLVNAQARVVRQRVQPIGLNAGSDGTSVRFLLPMKSICDLRSLAFHYDYTISGLTDGAVNFSNVMLFPPSYQHWSNIKVIVSGATAAGAQCNQYDMAHHLLLKASAGEDYCNSRLYNCYNSLLTSPGTARPGDGITSKSQRMTFDDLVLFRSRNHLYDSSLLGSLEIELQFNKKNIMKVVAAGTKATDAAALAATYAEINHAFSNITLSIDTVVSIAPMYVSLLSERLSVSQPIRYPFSEIRTVLASNTGANRVTLQGNCIDAVAVAFLNQDANSGAAVADATGTANVARYKYGLAGADAAARAANANQINFQLTVGSEVFGRVPIQLHEMIDNTINAMYGVDARSTNLLFHGVTGGAQSYSLDNAANNNVIAITKFAAAEEGWASPQGLLCGLQTQGVATDCVVSSNQTVASNVLIAVLQTSQVVFDPSTSAVSIEA